MIGSIDIRVNAARPNIPLCDMFAFQGSPSSIRVIDVPRSIGDWEITSVKLVVAYPNNNTVERVATRVGNVWVATVEGCSICGKVEDGYQVMADGIDEQGNPVEGYVLGKGNVFVLENKIDVERLVNKFTVRYLKNLPDVPSIGDLVEFSGTMKLFDGHDWIDMGGGGGGDVNDSTITIEKNGVEVGSFTTNASEATTIDIPVPSTTSDLTNDSGFITASAIPSTVSSFDNDVGYITASAIPPIPSQTSDLENDSGYITASAIPPIPSTTNDLVNDSGFITASAIPSQVSAFGNDVGYITASQVQPASNAHYAGWAEGAKQTVMLEGINSQGFPYNQIYAYIDSNNIFKVRENVYAPWYLSEYNGTTFDPALEMTFGYRGTLTMKIGARIRQVAINAYCWLSGRFLIKAELDDTYYQPTQFGMINNSGVVEWYETTFNSGKTSIETVGGQSGIITCTRSGYVPAYSIKEVAYTDQIPSSVSQLTNDAGYITASAIPSQISAFQNDVGYLSAVSWSQVSDKPDVALVSQIPTTTASLVNDSGFITASALSGYATVSYVDGKVLALSSIYALDSDLDLVVASVSSMDGSIQTIDTSVQTLELNVSDIQTYTGELGVSISALNASVSSIQTSLSTFASVSYVDAKATVSGIGCSTVTMSGEYENSNTFSFNVVVVPA